MKENLIKLAVSISLEQLVGAIDLASFRTACINGIPVAPLFDLSSIWVSPLTGNFMYEFDSSSKYRRTHLKNLRNIISEKYNVTIEFFRWNSKTETFYQITV